MKKKSQKSSGYEYVFKFRKKISALQKKEIIELIKQHHMFNRSYEKYGKTWYEMRSKNNRNVQKSPDASLFIATDFLYLMRKSKAPRIWDTFDDLGELIQDDLEFICEGVFYSAQK